MERRRQLLELPFKSCTLGDDLASVGRRHEPMIGHLVGECAVVLVANSDCRWGIGVRNNATNGRLIEYAECLICTTAPSHNDYVDRRILVESGHATHQLLEGIWALDARVLNFDVDIRVTTVEGSDCIYPCIAVGRCDKPNGSRKFRERLFSLISKQAILGEELLVLL